MKWNAIFILINVLFVAILLLEEHSAQLTLDSEPEMEALYTNIFKPSGMSVLDFKRMMQHAHWADLEPGETLCKEGTPSTRLYLVVRGKAAVSVNHRPEAGSFDDSNSSSEDSVPSTRGHEDQAHG